MSSRKLRKQLSQILKQKGYNKLYSCPKRIAYRRLDSNSLRYMINALTKIKIGDKTHQWGVNQIVVQEPKPIWYDCQYWMGHGHGKYLGEISQALYASGQLSCGCGDFNCFFAYRLHSKAEIIEKFTNSLKDKSWGPSAIALYYFEMKEQGFDLLTEDGFLIDNWDELTQHLNVNQLRLKFESQNND